MTEFLDLQELMVHLNPTRSREIELLVSEASAAGFTRKLAHVAGVRYPGGR